METLSLESIATVKVLVLFAVSFVLTVLSTPILTHYLYKYKLGKSVRNDTSATPIVAGLHKHKQGTPTMGGILIWGTTVILAFAIYYLATYTPLSNEFNFLTRKETWLPLGVLVFTALVGLVDDIFNIQQRGKNGGGLHLWQRVLLFTGIAVGAAWWFYFKLDWTLVHIPFWGNLDIGLWSVPFIITIIIATAFSVNETDGLDGLAGGVLLTAFLSYGAIAFTQGRYDLATFCAVICGALLAFLWFNIHPARFFMGDTGAMSLGVTLGVVALLTNSVWLLPFIGFILVLESASVLIQWTSKGFRKGKKVFRAAPIHHHFEAKGWEEPKIVMRFWIISGVMAVLSLVFFLIDRAVLLQ